MASPSSPEANNASAYPPAITLTPSDNNNNNIAPPRPIRQASSAGSLRTFGSVAAPAGPRSPSMRVRRLRASTVSQPPHMSALEEGRASSFRHEQSPLGAPNSPEADQTAGSSSPSPRKRALSSASARSGLSGLLERARGASPVPDTHHETSSVHSRPRSASQGSVDINYARPNSPSRKKGNNDAASAQSREQQEYDQQVVDLLDVIDPEVQAMTTLSNVQNSLFVPNLGNYFQRTPQMTLTRRPTGAPVTPGELPAGAADPRTAEGAAMARRATAMSAISRRSTVAGGPRPLTERRSTLLDQFQRQGTKDSSAGEHAVLPDGYTWDDWTEEEREELDDYVRHLMHSKKEAGRRKWRGFLKFASRRTSALSCICCGLLKASE